MPDLVPLGTEILGKTKAGRPIIRNPDGSVSTERRKTIEVDGEYFNIPTIYGGKAVSIEEAFTILKQSGFVDPDTGQRLKGFKSLQEAEKAARQRSRDLAVELQGMGILKKSVLGEMMNAR